SSNDYSKGALGGLSNILITLSNSSGYKLDEVLVEVEYLLPNERVFKTESLSFRNLSSNGSQTLDAPKSSRGIKIRYRVRSIQSTELGL
ncbi:MAG: hypothetical protein ACKO6K_03150, partial [Chitinophagaceae bacterium]